MPRYAPLLSITGTHAFYADGLCRGLRFTPSKDTAQWLEQADCACRESGAGLEVHSARGPAGGPPAPTLLSWTLRCEDPRFAAITEGLPAARDELLWVRSDSETSATLHADIWPLRWPQLTQVLSAQERTRPALAVVQIPAPSVAPVAYRFAFAARAPIWKYCFVGPWSADALEVIEPSSESSSEANSEASAEPAFETPVPEHLDNGQPMLACRSRSGIELREQSDKRFQLRARSAAAPRVLVKRLPVAGADHFARETIHGVPTLVSEIFVHR